VKLSPSFDPPFTGAHWECMTHPNGGDVLASAGANFGFRYLDGRTQDGFVQTVGDTLPPFSGTRWKVQEVSPGVVTIMSLGDFHNPDHLFLDGRTQDGSVGLAPSASPPFSGTRWGVRALGSASLDVESERTSSSLRLAIRGQGFTPGDSVVITIEGIVGSGGPKHSPRAFGPATRVGSDGAFRGATAEVDFVAIHPADIPIIVRATDHNGRTATRPNNHFHL
jgi:hypothetical protein